MNATKPCDGPGLKLAPIRGSHLVAQEVATPVSAGAAGAATPAGKPKYIPPWQRSAAAAAGAAATPRTAISSDELMSPVAFPSLGSVTSPKVNWGQLGQRLTAATPMATPLPLASENQFSALDETAVSSTGASALNFKEMIKERIEKDVMEAFIAAEEAETEDPLTMSYGRLLSEGWEIGNLPNKEDQVQLTDWMLDRGSRFEPDVQDLEEAGFKNGESWDGRFDVAARIVKAGEEDSHKVLQALCRDGRAGENIWQKYMEETGGYGGAGGLGSPTATPAALSRPMTNMQRLIERKRAVLRARRAAGATAAAENRPLN